jgi:hypothetical protein
MLIPPTRDLPLTIECRRWNKKCYVDCRMFAGSIQNEMILADQPVLVVDGPILNSFSRIEEATEFVTRQHSDTAIILRHNGQNWDILPRGLSPAETG